MVDSKTSKFSKNIFTENIKEKQNTLNNELTSYSVINQRISINNNNNINNNTITTTAKETKKKNNITSTLTQKELRRAKKLHYILQNPLIDLCELKKFCWQGISLYVPKNRSECWKYLLGFYPLNSALKESTIQKKKDEYSNFCDKFSKALSNPEGIMNEQEQAIYRQILKDVPRTMSECAMFQTEKIQNMMTRILYIWSQLHPASGYVQGFNDLTTPFFVVFFLEHFPNCEVKDLLSKNIDQLKEVIDERTFFDIETDIYFCLSKLLDRIQTHYTKHQPGIRQMMAKMEKIVEIVDKELSDYLKMKEVDYIQFCFRWMNCFLMREFSIDLIIRLWDTYFSEDNGFSDFHLYVCACLLLNFSEKLKKMTEFQEMIMFLQKLPTETWTESDIEVLLSKSYQIHVMYSSIIKNIDKDKEK